MIFRVLSSPVLASTPSAADLTPFLFLSSFSAGDNLRLVFTFFASPSTFFFFFFGVDCEETGENSSPGDTDDFSGWSLLCTTGTTGLASSSLSFFGSLIFLSAFSLAASSSSISANCRWRSCLLFSKFSCLSKSSSPLSSQSKASFLSSSESSSPQFFCSCSGLWDFVTTTLPLKCRFFTFFLRFLRSSSFSSSPD